MSQAKIFKLTKEEANLLQTINPSIKCPLKLHTRERRIWWVIEEIGQGHYEYPYSVCQQCYTNNNFGSKPPSIKDQLMPVITNGIISLNCDASKIKDCHPIDLQFNWKMSVYMTYPETKLLNAHLGNNQTVIVESDINNFHYAVCFYKKETDENKCVLYKLFNSSSNTALNSVVHKSYPNDQEYNVTIDSYETSAKPLIQVTPDISISEKYKKNLLVYEPNNETTNNLTIELFTSVTTTPDIFSPMVAPVSYATILSVSIEFKINEIIPETTRDDFTDQYHIVAVDI